MNWYKKAQVNITPEQLIGLKAIVQKLVEGNMRWTSEELQLQGNFSEILETLLKDQYELKGSI